MSTSYIRPAISLKLRSKTVNCLIKLIKESGVEFDAIVLRGMSGAIIVPAVADRLKKPFIVCRKDDKHHSSLQVEYQFDGTIARYIIIDDLISSGGTIKTIVEMMRNEANRDKWEEEGQLSKEIKCVGIFLYNDYCDYKEGFESIPVWTFLK